MKLYEETNVTCIKENDFNLEVGKEYMITYLEWDSNTGEYTEIWLDDGSMPTLKITVKEFAQIFKIPYSFEEAVIDVILNTIKDNQEYLTEPENLPQLAKLGYMYNLLWYSGRVCWGHDGVFSEGGYDCEDNPKYKIDMCEPKNDKIENLIYDAWGMHVSNDGDTRNYDDFLKILFEKRELSEYEVKMLKVNKTFDEWVEVLTDEEFKYNSIYPNRRSVANHLLCTIGNGYGINSDGFVISEAGGADQDKSQYGDWENAIFSPEIEKIVRNIASLTEVKDTINASAEKAKEWEKEKSDREKGVLKSHIGKEFTQKAFDTLNSTKLWDKIFKSDRMEKALRKEHYNPYYPISDYSIIDIMVNPNSLKREGITKIHQSYIDVGIEICKEILEHEEEENKRQGNVEFAKIFLGIQGVEEYKEFIPEHFDVDVIMEEIKDHFSSVTYDKLYLNDTRINKYADDNANFVIETKPDEPMIVGVSNNVEYIKGTKLYSVLKPALDKILNMKEVYQLVFDYQNTDRFYMSVKIILNEKYVNVDKVKSDKEFVEDGFMVSSNVIMKPLNNYLMVSKKPETLGSKHPNNKEGKDYFSQAKYFHICDKDWKVLLNFHIDERGFNTFYADSKPQSEELRKLQDTLTLEHRKLKASDKKYGTYNNVTRKGSEGKKSLYVHEFMNWMENKYSRKAKLDKINGV